MLNPFIALAIVEESTQGCENCVFFYRDTCYVSPDKKERDGSDLACSEFMPHLPNEMERNIARMLVTGGMELRVEQDG